MSEKPVLGLFESEAELRDHIAAGLEVLEEGLDILGQALQLARSNP